MPIPNKIPRQNARLGETFRQKKSRIAIDKMATGNKENGANANGMAQPLSKINNSSKYFNFLNNIIRLACKSTNELFAMNDKNVYEKKN